MVSGFLIRREARFAALEVSHRAEQLVSLKVARIPALYFGEAAPICAREILDASIRNEHRSSGV